MLSENYTMRFWLCSKTPSAQSTSVRHRLTTTFKWKLESRPIIQCKNGFLLIVRTSRFLPLDKLGVLEDTRIFQHIANFSMVIADQSPPILFFWGERLGRRHGSKIRTYVQILEDSAPLKLPARFCLWPFLPARLDYIFWKIGVSSSDPSTPKGKLQILPTTLRIKNI